MRILIIAPEPLFEERGTPIAVRMLLEELAGAGYDCDVLTYADPRGSEMAGFELIQVPHLDALDGVPPGPSVKKLFCDVLLAGKLAQLLRHRTYDVIHAVEEAVFLGLAAWKFYGIPYVYDMDSSLSQQLLDRWRLLRPARRLLEGMERLAIRNSAGVLAVCSSLERVAAATDGNQMVERLQDVSLLDVRNQPSEDLRAITGAEGPLILYVGNLQPYQGIDLLLESFALAADRSGDAALVIVGGKSAGIETYRKKAADLGISDRVHLTGSRPLDQLATLLKQADILVSPRINGTNTPMKIYSYLDSGRPLLATRIPAHTQVLDDDVALRVEPEPQAMADGLLRLLGEEDLRRRLGARGRERARLEHSRKAFRRKLLAFYRRIDARIRAATIAARNATR